MFRCSVGDELELRLLEVRHTEALFALMDENRAHLRQWLPWLDYNTTVEDSRAFVRTCMQQFADNNGFQAGIWVEDELAGVVGLHWINWGNRSTSLGYWLGAEYLGRGVMTRACAAVIEHAFDDLGLNRIDLRCATGNAASCAIAQRLGFSHEGVARQAEWLYDHFVDHNVYALLAEEWKK